MTVSGYIYDNQTNAVLPGASVIVIDNTGNAPGDGTAADENGYFTIASPYLNQGAKLSVSNVGYTTALFDPNFANAYQAIGLDQNTTPMQAATVTATIPKKNSIVPALLAGGALLLLATSGKHKRTRVGDISPQAENLILTGGIAVGAYFLVLKPILEKLGLLQSAQDKATLAAQQASLAQAQQNDKSKGLTGKPSYSPDQYTGWANEIYNLGGSATPVAQTDQDTIVHDVINANTLTDIQSLIVAFGTRTVGGGFWSICDWTLGTLDCQKMDLPTFLRSVLDDAHLGTINKFLADTDINYVF